MQPSYRHGMDGEPIMRDKQMRLRFDGVCRICGDEILAGAQAIYERSTKTVRCLTHRGEDVADGAFSASATAEVEHWIDSGTPGASARREFERRSAKREERIRAQHPRLGGVILAISDNPQSTRAWNVGAVGEERLGERLNEFASDTFRVLHDRRIPGTRANIDHIVVAPSGVYVIDAKKYKGRPTLKVEGGLIRPRVEKLLVGTRDRTRLVDGVLKQVGVVREAVGSSTPIHGVLCFVEADWPLLGGAFTTRGIDVVWPKKLYSKLQAIGPVVPEGISELHRLLAQALPMS